MRKGNFWVRFLVLEGLLLVGLGGGWIMGAWVGWVKLLPWGLLGGGLMCLSSGGALWSFLAWKATPSVQNRSPRAVDLDESFRALRAFGTQPPLWDRDGLRTQLLSVGALTKWTSPAGRGVIVEHWSGPEVTIRSGKFEASLGERQLLKLTNNSGELELETDRREKQNSMILLHEIRDNA